MAGNALNTFLVRIPVQAGDVIGFSFQAPLLCGRDAPGRTGHSILGDQGVGSVATYLDETSWQLDVSAVLEPDADNDGFGDETQDACPADPALQEAPCDRVAPTAQITKNPKDKVKTKKKKAKATFEFAGSDSRAIAGFQCSLDGAPFTACTSPHTVKVKKGKHTFQVRAVDQAGNVGTTATDTWKVKKKNS